MQRCAVSTPGKVILLGEHAVVYGEPAVVSAVDLRVHATLSPLPSPRARLVLEPLHYVREHELSEIREISRSWRDRWERARDAGHPIPTLPSTAPELLAIVALGEAMAASGPVSGGFELRIASALPIGSGLGSSAAITMAIIAAFLRSMGGSPDDSTLFRVALDAERRQHGTPSGVDTAAVLHGGVLWVERRPGGPPSFEPLGAPSPLLGKVGVYHSGTPADTTGEVVAAVRARLDSEESIRGALPELGMLARQLRALMTDSGASDQLPAMRELLRRAERELERLGVVPAPVRNLIRAIEARGGAAKISGAGALRGGAAGTVLVLPEDGDDLSELLQEWRRLDVHLGAAGLRSEPLS